MVDFKIKGEGSVVCLNQEFAMVEHILRREAGFSITEKKQRQDIAFLHFHSEGYWNSVAMKELMDHCRAFILNFSFLGEDEETGIHYALSLSPYNQDWDAWNDAILEGETAHDLVV